MKRPTQSLIHVPEPLLEFRYGQQLEYARDGLFLFGPVDAGSPVHRVRYGVIGTRAGVSRLADWAQRVREWIPAPQPRRGAKIVELHHMPFPGFSEAFAAEWPTRPERVIDDLDEAELRTLLNIVNRHEAVKRAVDLFVDRLAAEQRRSETPPAFWFVVIPEFVYTLGRQQSRPAPNDRVAGEVRISHEEAVRLKTFPSLFGDSEREAEVYDYVADFRRQLKARLLVHQVVTQLVRETTLLELGPADGVTAAVRRKVEDPATLAWKLGTAAYYKSGGRPWQLAAVREGVCYVGLVFKAQPTSTDSRWACCAAQMFMSNGDGVVFRGALGPWKNEDTGDFHLNRSAAEHLIRTVVEEYSAREGAPPRELFVHAKAACSDEEWEGFCAAVDRSSTTVVAVQIFDSRHGLKLFRRGAYPTIRGTALVTGKREAFLFASGYVPRLDTYLGPGTPNPLSISIRRGDAPIGTVLEDVLSLTKLNFNTCMYGDKVPVTIRFADAIGEVLAAAPQEAEPRLPFKFYI